MLVQLEKRHRRLQRLQRAGCPLPRNQRPWDRGAGRPFHPPEQHLQPAAVAYVTHDRLHVIAARAAPFFFDQAGAESEVELITNEL